MAMYSLRGIDDKLWARVWDKVHADGVSFKWMFIALLTLYADGKVQLPTETEKHGKALGKASLVGMEQIQAMLDEEGQ